MIFPKLVYLFGLLFYYTLYISLHYNNEFIYLLGVAQSSINTRFYSSKGILRWEKRYTRLVKKVHLDGKKGIPIWESML